ncbi:MAG: M4 family metallopeptidase [Polyangiaceae bacterium]|nr:M4 family metallopeptidase [Polyangiaceae bacterium]
MSHKLIRGFGAIGMVIAAAACTGTDDTVSELRDRDGTDIQAYLSALPSARVIDVDRAGIPTFLGGTLAFVDIQDDARDVDMSAALEAIAPVFRANAADLVLQRADTDDIGDQHFRYRQIKNGLDVLGGEIMIHVRDGFVYGANGQARDDLDIAVEPEIQTFEAVELARAASAETVSDLAVGQSAPLAYRHGEGRMDLVYMVEVTGVLADQTPVHDTVLVNAVDGSIVDRMAHIHSAKNRALYSANNGTSLPGTLKRSEGGAATSDATVNGNYDLLGWTYDCYKNLFARDSYNNAGAQMKSSVHYSTNYCNAFWNSTQMVYGDGSASQGCGNLALSMDVTAHELTHAVTEYESNLTYSGESGGLNESMSDIFGNVCELYRDGGNASATTLGSPSSDTWLVGEDVLAPFLRSMSNPTADGSSLDFWTSSAGSVDVHYSSGISNLAFYLLSQGGTHPQGKSSVNVTGIGINKAAQIFYRANRDKLGASSNFAAAKTATETAATELGYTAAEVASVTAAWNAVGVGVAAPPPSVTPLSNGVAVTGIGGSTGSQKFYSLVVPSGQTTLTFTTSGGTGDVDLYTNFGAVPSLTTYTCRPYASGNAETCTVTNPAAGTYYVMLNAYSTYSGVTLTGTYSSGGGGGGNVLTNGVPVTNISGASGSSQVLTLSVPAGKASLSFTMSGGTGDADMYVKYGSSPTDSSYNCRPYLSGNNESCSFTNPSSGTWYVRLKGYSAYSGVSLVGQHP